MDLSAKTLTAAFSHTPTGDNERNLSTGSREFAEWHPKSL